MNYRDFPDNFAGSTGRPEKYGFSKMLIGDEIYTLESMEKVRKGFFSWRDYKKSERGGIKMHFVQDGDRVIVRRVA